MDQLEEIKETRLLMHCASATGFCHTQKEANKKPMQSCDRMS